MALLAAFANAVASVCQRLGVEEAPATNGPSITLVRYMLQRPVWIMGFVVMALGYGAQAVALHLGGLNVVQPLLVSELVILVFVLWLWYSTPLRLRDLAASIATALGLGTFLFVSAPSEGTRVPDGPMWLTVGGIVVFVATLFVIAGSRGPAWWRALSLGAGAAVGFALLSGVTKSMTGQLLTGWSALFGSWQIYALVVIGLGSFLVMQSAFQVGPFAVSQSSLILVNPFVSIAIGHVFYGENLRGGPVAVSLEVVALVVMVVGAVGLSTSSLVAGVHDESHDTHLLKGRGRYARRHHAS
jgi:hypothetical protein